MSRIDEFFNAVADAWGDEPLKLHVIGSGALMLLTDYVRGTKDGDVLRTLDLDDQIKNRLENLAGPRSKLAKQWKLHIDIVDNGVPFLPLQPVWHRLETGHERLELFALDVTDVVVSKLKRFNANDRSDIDAMIERGSVEHARLVERFESAVDAWQGDARAEDLPGYVKNLNEVERDSFAVEPTDIELPTWI